MTTTVGRPRLPIQIIHDEQGKLVIYTGTTCDAPGCGIELTSRNRYQMNRLCLTHGKEKTRERNSQKRATAKAKALKESPQGSPEEFIRVPDPKRREIHSLLTLWLRWPTDEQIAERLQAALVDHEMKARLLDLLPPPPSLCGIPSIPLEEPSEDRDDPTRRLMFVAACDDYGV